MFEQPELEVAMNAARNAASVLLKYFRQQNQIQFKSEYNLVSEADLQSEKVIVETIRSAFPGHEILGEESATAALDAEYLWTVDPLDGTNNFCHGIEHFAISIAWAEQGETKLGVVYRPLSDEWFVAGKGRGAFHNGVACQTRNFQRLNEALIAVGFYYDREGQMRATLRAIESLFGHNIHGIRRMGTASLDLCMTGTGRLGGYFEFELAPWDYAAGKLFVEEAGGVVTDCTGHLMSSGNSSILASCPDLHAALLQNIKPHFETLVHGA